MKSKSTLPGITMQSNDGNQLQKIVGKNLSDPFPKYKFLPVTKTMVLLLILMFSVSVVQAATKTSVAAGGNWNTAGTWSPSGVPAAGDAVIIAGPGAVLLDATITQTGAGSVTVNSGAALNITTTGADATFGALTINSGGTVTVYRDFIVLGATNISGTINFGSTSGTSRSMTFTGDVTLNSGAVWNETSAGSVADFSFGGNFTNNATTFTAQNNSLAVHTFTGTAKTLGGTTITAIPYVTISGTRTNNGTLTVSSILAGASALTNGAAGILNIGGTSTITTLTATAVGNIVNYTGTAQTCKVTTYDNLNLSGSGAKTFITTPTVNGVLSLEGTASVVITTGVVTYNTNATLRYNKPGPYTATSEEWITPFAATGGVIIANAGAITMDAAKVFNASVPLTINSGATLVTNNLQLTLGGDFINGGTLTAGSSPIVIANNMTTQSIAGFTTTGLVSMTKTGGTATLLGNVNGAGCTFNGTGGTLNFGTALTHTFTSDLTLSAGTLNCGSSTLRLAGGYSGTGVTFISGSGTVDWNASGPQTIPGGGYYNLILSGSGTKTVPASTSVAGDLTITGTALADLSGTANTANALNFGTSQQASGTWGSTSSIATHTSDSRFSGTGLVTVATGGCVSPAITGQPDNQSITYGVDASFTVTATGDGLSYKWQEFISTWSDITNGGIYSNSTTATLNLTRPVVSMSTYKYRCVVTGTCSTLNSDGNATLTVNQKALTVTATGPTKEYGTALLTGTTTTNFTAGATGVGTEVVTGLTLTPNAAGILAATAAGAAYVVTPSLATGSGGFAAGNYNITYVHYNGTVTAKALTITATGPAKEYGTALTAGISAINFTHVGEITGETITGVTLTPDAAGLSAATAAGSVYNVTPSLATGAGAFTASNYNITYTPFSGTVTAKAMTITATGPTKEYGTALTAGISAINFTHAGEIAGEAVTGVTLTPSAAGISATTVAGTAYAVTPSLATGTGGFLAGNYNIAYVPYNGTVSTKPLTVTATGPTKQYGTALTASASTTNFTSGATGVGSELVTSVMLTPDAAGISATTVAGTSYVVTPSLATGTGGFTASNYNITYLPFTTGTVTTKPLAVAATGPVKAYGTALTTGTSTTNFTAGPTGVGTETVTGVTLTPDAAGLLVTTPAGAAYIVVPSIATGTGGFAASNYNITYANFNGTVSAKALTVTGATAVSKTYDGNNIAAISGAVLSGVVNGDDVTLDALSGTFTQVTIGTGITVNANLTLKGAALASYTLTQPVGLAANITPKGIIIIPAAGQGKVLGNSDPLFAYTNSEWVSNVNFTGSLGRDAGEIAGNYSYTLGNLSAGTNYLLVMVGLPSTFSITVPTGIEDLNRNSGMTLRNYPNPFRGNTTVSYTIPFEGKVTLAIRNLSGQVVKTILSEMQTEGDYVLKIEAGDLQPGVYMATLSLKKNGKEILKTIRLVKGN